MTCQYQRILEVFQTISPEYGLQKYIKELKKRPDIEWLHHKIGKKASKKALENLDGLNNIVTLGLPSNYEAYNDYGNLTIGWFPCDSCNVNFSLTNVCALQDFLLV